MLTDKQTRFVAEYLKDLNATQATIRAGYSENGAEVQGFRLLRDAKISAAVAEGKARQLKSADLSAARVLEELRRLAFSNVQDLFDAEGNLRRIQDLSPDQAACIASLEVIKKNAVAGDGHIDVIHKLKVWDKTKTLEMLAKHFALLTDVVKLSGNVSVVDRLVAARKRLSERKGEA